MGITTNQNIIVPVEIDTSQLKAIITLMKSHSSHTIVSVEGHSIIFAGINNGVLIYECNLYHFTNIARITLSKTSYRSNSCDGYSWLTDIESNVAADPTTKNDRTKIRWSVHTLGDYQSILLPSSSSAAIPLLGAEEMAAILQSPSC